MIASGVFFFFSSKRKEFIRHEFAQTPRHNEGQGSCILSPCLFNLYAEYIMRNAGLEDAQAGIKIAEEISITSDMQMTPPL